MKKTVIIGAVAGLAGGFLAVLILRLLEVNVSPSAIGGAVGGAVGAVASGLGGRAKASSR